jgi:indolepyruvate ferredoxin oxidoreductase
LYPKGGDPVPAESETDVGTAELPASAWRQVTLTDKYDQTYGRVFLTGVQALVRLALDQRRADVKRGLNTATFISGYQGSPLAGFDQELGRHKQRLQEHEVVHQPGLNEELAATSVWGSQLSQQLPDPSYDGVVGMWYGKNPGLDRAADAIRHANYCGVGPTGGAVCFVGDDPVCKSSTLPSASEATLATSRRSWITAATP